MAVLKSISATKPPTIATDHAQEPARRPEVLRPGPVRPNYPHDEKREEQACEWAAYARLRPEGIEQQHDNDGECGDDLHDEMPGFKI